MEQAEANQDICVIRRSGTGALEGAARSGEIKAPIHQDIAKCGLGDRKIGIERNRALAAHLDTLAKAKGCQSGQIALAWLLAQGDDIVPIPGTKQVGRIDENLGALDVKLSPDELVALSEAFPPGAAAGTRYPAGGMKGVFL